jgi:hypothetical protein
LFIPFFRKKYGGADSLIESINPLIRRKFNSLIELRNSPIQLINSLIKPRNSPIQSKNSLINLISFTVAAQYIIKKTLPNQEEPESLLFLVCFCPINHFIGFFSTAYTFVRYFFLLEWQTSRCCASIFFNFFLTC